MCVLAYRSADIAIELHSKEYRHKDINVRIWAKEHSYKDVTISFVKHLFC